MDDGASALAIHQRQSPATCDRCSKDIEGIRYKCQQCPDFDYCTDCVSFASGIHPGHDFTTMRGGLPLSDEELAQHVRPPDQGVDTTAFRLLGQDLSMPEKTCLSCSPVTMVLPAIAVILQTKELRDRPRDALRVRWPARISTLVEATASGCAFCSMTLHKFFGPGNGQLFAYEPEVPWMCQPDNEQRQVVIKHAMHILTLAPSDGLLFDVDPLHSKGSTNGDFHRLRVTLSAAKQGDEILKKILASAGQPYYEFDVYAAEGNPAASSISSRPPNASPASPEGLEKLKSWLARCEQEHGDACAASSSVLPTRLIDVSDGDRLHLYEAASEEEGRYVALSYCWGGPQEFQTTATTVDNRRGGFALSDLPQTLQDAVTVTQALDIRYLWVDSICIIQDDAADKANEIAHMADIYKRATLTISASKADSASKGFLHGDPDAETGLWKNLVPLAFPLPSPAASSLKDAMEMPREVFGTAWLCDEDVNMATSFRSSVDRRGWCLQERLLSNRLVSYGRWPTWKCGLSAETDGGVYRENPRDAPHELQLSNSLFEHRQQTQQSGTSLHTTFQLMHAWAKLVREYTQRELGDKSDRLPAIGGIASEISRLTGSPYIAGLWQTNLLHDLMWSTKAKEWLIRPDGYVGPTWSWAAVDCPVSYEELTDDSLEVAQVFECDVEATQSGPFGQVKAGHLQIEGLFGKVEKDDVITLFTDQGMGPSPPKNNDTQEWYRQIMEFVNNLPKGDESTGDDWIEKLPDEVFAIITFSRRWRVVNEERVEVTCYSGLLLCKADGGYKRIAAFTNEDRDWISQIVALRQRRTITLI